MSEISTQEAVVRLLVAFALAYAIGFERELRGSAAGNRTFSLVGLAGALAGIFAVTHSAATAFSGVITGVGFIGAAVAVHVAGKDGGLVRGLTTATSILATAVIGTACGSGLLLASTVATALALASLELRWMPGLRRLDANYWASRVKSETGSGSLAHTAGDQGPENTT